MHFRCISPDKGAIMSMLLSGEQLRAARALARIEQADLAKRCGLSVETIKRLERFRGPIDANVKTLRAIEDSFQRLGVKFGSGDGGGAGVWLVEPARDRRSTSSNLSYLNPRRGQPIHRLIYFSTAIPMADQEMLAALRDITRISGPRNHALDVTGALLACNGRFLQVLEGDKEAVLQIYGAICTDRRHQDLHITESGPAASRRFSAWNLYAKLLQPDHPVFADGPARGGGFDPRDLSSAIALDLLATLARGVDGHEEAMRA
jgi:transcriptional regulator with XRE-family HTH domain